MRYLFSREMGNEFDVRVEISSNNDVCKFAFILLNESVHFSYTFTVWCFCSTSGPIVALEKYEWQNIQNFLPNHLRHYNLLNIFDRRQCLLWLKWMFPFVFEFCSQCCHFICYKTMRKKSYKIGEEKIANSAKDFQIVLWLWLC